MAAFKTSWTHVNPFDAVQQDALHNNDAEPEVEQTASTQHPSKVGL